MTAFLAKAALEHGAKAAGGPRVTAHLAENTAPAAPKLQKDPQHQLIDDAIGQLLVLLSQRASHEILVEKVEALYGHVRALLPKTPNR